MSAFTVPVLLYHHVFGEPLSPPPRFAGSYLPLAELRAQLDDLARRGVETVTLSRAVGDHAGAFGRSVVLTFDDGCECFARLVLPELEKRRMTATVFAVAGRLGDVNRWDAAAGERRERLMDATELRRLAAAGIEIGCHSLEHRDLTRVGADELEREVDGARADLAEAVGRPPTTFCYPYGRFDAAARAAVERAGFAAAVSVWGYPGASRRDRLALPRVEIAPGESAASFRLKSGAVYPWIRRLPRLGLLGVLRRGGPPERGLSE